MMVKTNDVNFDLDRLYNREYKERFILNYHGTHESRNIVFWHMLKAADYEKMIKKDMSEMNYTEIKEMLLSGGFSTVNSALNHISTYKSYIEYVGVTSSPFYAFDSLIDLAKEVVAKEKNKRYTREELLNMLDELNNIVDQALLLALFEGIKGKSFSELLTLKTNNLSHEENDGVDSYFAKVYDSGTRTERTIKISEHLFKLLHMADKERYYVSNNENENNKTEYNETEFIFKKSKKGKQSNDLVLDRHFITRKFLFFKDFFGNTYLTADDIVQSGMLHRLHELFLESKKITNKELTIVGNEYNTPMVTTLKDGKKHSYRNVSDIKRKVFSGDFKTLYPAMSNLDILD